MNLLVMLASAGVLLANGMTFGSPIIGAVGSIAYLIVGGYMLRGIFGKKHTVADWAFGVLMLIIILAVIGWIFTISYKLGVRELFITLVLAAFSTLLIQKFTSDRTSVVEAKVDSVPVSARWLEMAFVAFLCLQIIFLLQSRTSLPDRVWVTMNPWVMVLFFVNTALLVALMFTAEKWQVKLLLIVGHSILAHMFFVLVFDVGYGWDQFITLGITRRLFDESAWPQNIAFSLHTPGSLLVKVYRVLAGTLAPVLSTTLSRMFGVDVLWGHLLLVPLLWGIFVPIIAYRITEIVTGKQKLALFSGLLTLTGPSLILWGAVSTSNSLGFALFFFAIYLIIDYLVSDRKILWAALGVFVTVLAHLMVGIIASSLFLLAFTLKRSRGIKREKRRKIFLSLAFLVCLGILPLFLSLGWLFYPIRTGVTFTLEPLLSLPPFDAVMMFLVGAYGDYTLKEAIVYGALPLLGLSGLIYVNKSRRFAHKRMVNLFLLLSFVLISLEYLMAKCFMLYTGFGKERLWILRDLISIPLASTLIYNAMEILANLLPKGIASRNISFKGFSSASFKRIASKTTTVLLVSGLIASSVYIGYPTSRRSRWLAAHELEAAKFIDSTTDVPYVVVCYQAFKVAGYTAVGFSNPLAYYAPTYDYGWNAELISKVSEGSAAEAMIEAAAINNASIAFFVTNPSREVGADSMISLLSQRPGFELSGIFGDEVYVFRYVVPLERVVKGIGPSVYLFSHEEYVNTTFTADAVTYEAEFEVSLNGSNRYELTNWPNHWSFESISPGPVSRYIDANLWINFTARENVEYNVSWTANLLYQDVGWKDDSFLTGWTRYKAAPLDFREETTMQTDGDVLTITGNFEKGSRQYYWIWKPVDVSTDLYSYVLVRWRSTGTCAIAWAYYMGGKVWNQRILTYGSYNPDWTTTVVRLQEGAILTDLMIGLDDSGADAEGSLSAYFDFVMVANATFSTLLAV